LNGVTLVLLFQSKIFTEREDTIMYGLSSHHILFFISSLMLANAFTSSTNGATRGKMNVSRRPVSFLSMAAKKGTSKSFRVSLKLPSKSKDSPLQDEVLIFEPVLKEKSKIIEVRYELPYSLDVEKNEVTGLPTCYMSGWNGEVPDDILRFCSAWTEDGECVMHDCCEGSWEECVEALMSNAPAKTDEVVLLFERALSSIYNV